MHSLCTASWQTRFPVISLGTEGGGTRFGLSIGCLAPSPPHTRSPSGSPPRTRNRRPVRPRSRAPPAPLQMPTLSRSPPGSPHDALLDQHVEKEKSRVVVHESEETW